jgi:very-short-patch-repair endonuclease
MLIDLVCDYCGNPFKKRKAEVNRQLKKGRKYFFCNLSCGASWNNLHREGARVEVEKICPVCEAPFKTLTGAKSPTFCSSSCASKGSMSESRRAAQRKGGLDKAGNLIHVSQTLKIREDWKYKKIKSLLSFLKEDFEFEYSIDPYVFDLCLKGRKILIEFDGKYHAGTQLDIDRIKQEHAEKIGWKVVHIEVPDKAIIDPDLLYSILNK